MLSTLGPMIDIQPKLGGVVKIRFIVAIKSKFYEIMELDSNSVVQYNVTLQKL